MECERRPRFLQHKEWGRNLMFENLTDKLQRVFKNLRGQGKLTQEHVDEALAGIREALLEATSTWA